MLPLFLHLLSALPLTPATPLFPTIQCVHLPSVPPATLSDCTELLSLVSRTPRFRFDTAYISAEAISYGYRSCTFTFRGKAPASADRERFRLIEWFPAFQEIGQRCLESGQGWAGGRMDVGRFFEVGVGADGVVGGV